MTRRWMHGHGRTANASRCRKRLLPAAALAVACCVGCAHPEPPEATRARSELALLEGQIGELHKVIARADAGRLVEFRVLHGHLAARVELVEFRVLDTTVDRGAANAIQRLVRENRDSVAALIPSLDLPVRLDQAIEVGALDDGVVRTRPGRLPLALTVAEVLPFGGRLWVFVDLRAGPWQVGTQGSR